MQHTPSGGGRLAIAIQDLPEGMAARVTVTGPDGYLRHLTQPATLASVPAGSYTVWGDPVSDGQLVYHDQTARGDAVDGRTTRIVASYYTATPVGTRIVSGPDVVKVSTTTVVVSSTAVTRQLSAGDVILAGPTTAAPLGLLRRVNSVTPGQGSIQLATAPAALDDAFARLRVSADRRVTWRRTSLALIITGDGDQAMLAAAEPAVPHPEQSTKAGCEGAAGDPNKPGAEAGFTQEIDPDISVDIAIDRPLRLRMIEFRVAPTVKELLKVELSGAAVDCDISKTFATFSGAPTLIDTPLLV